MQKSFIIVGFILVLIGLAWPIIKSFGLGRLPSDIYIRKGHFSFYFPITTSLIISVIIMLILWLINR